jgi:hypothetical protein
VRKIVMSGLVAVAALFGCAGTAVAGTEQDSSGNLLGYGTGLSCASPTACLSIGTDVDAKASGTKPAVERLQAGTWKSVPVRTPKGALSTMLTGVSCKSATYCLVTGETDSISGGSPYALTWDGTTLTPIAGPPVPKADTGGVISAVSCVEVRKCVAVGAGSNKTTDASVLFIWTLSGTKWTLTAKPASNRSTDTEYTGLHCLSLTSCVAIGDSVDLTSGTDTPAAASWNGTKFTDLKAPRLTGASDATFDAVSCGSAHSCAVVGQAYTNSTDTDSFGFAEVWNGATWTATKWSGSKGDTLTALLDVSCTLAIRCMAVGVHGTTKTAAPAALAWNGTKWTVLKVPGPGAGKAVLFASVSCPVNGKCVAAGEGGKTGNASAPVTPIAGYWNGHAWRYGPM